MEGLSNEAERVNDPSLSEEMARGVEDKGYHEAIQHYKKKKNPEDRKFFTKNAEYLADRSEENVRIDRVIDAVRDMLPPDVLKKVEKLLVEELQKPRTPDRLN